MSLRAWGVTAAALVAVVVTGGPASALPVPTVPADVREVFGAEGPRQAQAGAAGMGEDFSGPVRADDVHEIFRFSATFVDGSPMNEPVVSTTQWVAALERGDEVLGTLGVWKPGGGPARPPGAATSGGRTAPRRWPAARRARQVRGGPCGPSR